MSTARIVRWKALRRWLPGHEGLPDSTFPLVPLADVLVRRDDRVEPNEFDAHTPITIRFSGAIEPRDRDTPFAGKMWAVQPGDLVFSKIDVRNGAIGLLPDTIGAGVVTSEYPVYVPEAEEVDAAFLARLLRTEPFQALLRAASSGTSGRKRVHPDQFEALEVPLPEVDEQRRLAAAHAAAYAEAAALEAEADRREAEAVQAFEAALGLTPPPDLPRQRTRIARFADLDRWSHEGAIYARLSDQAQEDSSVEWQTLGDFVEVMHGCSSSPAAEETGFWVLKISAATRGYFQPDERKPMHDDLALRARYDLKAGDILLCRTNGTLAYVGMSALVPDDLEGVIFPDKLIRVRITDPDVDPAFVWKALQLPSVRVQIEAAARTAVGNHAVGSSDIETFQLPLPSLSAQHSLVSELIGTLETADRNRGVARKQRAAADAAFAEALFG